MRTSTKGYFRSEIPIRLRRSGLQGHDGEFSWSAPAVPDTPRTVVGRKCALRPLTVLYIDLDNFKLVNDSLGHKTGNSVLRVATRTMQSTLREVDFVARLHGDEFALLLPETSAENVPLVLNKLQKVLREAMIAMQWPVTFSIGAVTFKTPTVSAEFMLDEADKVMYSAKQAGKNRVAHMVFAGGKQAYKSLDT